MRAIGCNFFDDIGFALAVSRNNILRRGISQEAAGFHNPYEQKIYGGKEGFLHFPSCMETVEGQKEDVGLDMECHRDTEGNVYDFAFGLDFQGRIQDSRTERYSRR